MSDLKVNKFLTVGTHFKISKGKKSEPSDTSTLRYIQIDDLRNDNNLKYALVSKTNVLCNKQDILIAWDGANAGTIGYCLEGAIGSTLAKLTPITNAVFSSYAGRFLQSKFKYLRENCTGATIPHISKASLINIKIPLLPLAEQQKIAAILDAADSLRQKDQQLVERYTALSQSLFLEMFGDPVTNPMGWLSVNWEDVLTIKNGKNQCKVVNSEGLYPIYGSGGIMGFADDYLCEAGTTVIGRKGSINKPIYVKTRFWNVDTAFGLCAGDNLNSIFLYYFCIKFNFLKLNKATTLPSLTKTDLLKITMPLPPMNLQNQFYERIQLIEAQKQQAQLSLAKSEALFNSLLQRAFTGELTAKLVA